MQLTFLADKPDPVLDSANVSEFAMKSLDSGLVDTKCTSNASVPLSVPTTTDEMIAGGQWKTMKFHWSESTGETIPPAIPLGGTLQWTYNLIHPIYQKTGICCMAVVSN